MKQDTSIRTNFEAHTLPPTPGKTAVPVIFFIGFGLFLFWSSLFLDRHAGGFNKQVYAPFESFAQVQASHPMSGDEALAMKGKAMFSTYCSPCHQETGLGAANLAPPLAGSEWVVGGGPNRIIRIVLNGLEGKVNVKGTDYEMSMLPWRETITNDFDVAAIVTYIRSNKGWGHSAGPVKPESVGAIRKATAGRDGRWTSEELQKVPDSD